MSRSAKEDKLLRGLGTGGARQAGEALSGRAKQMADLEAQALGGGPKKKKKNGS